MMWGKESQVTMMMATQSPLASQSQRRVRVLIVDDTPQVLQDLRQLLELTGLIEIIAEAREGAEAVRLTANLAPDVVLMDLEMPGMDGYDATNQIKTWHPAPRVIILSVHAGSEERDRARAAGADGFVTKGNNYEVLLNAILGRNGSPRSCDSGKGAAS